MPDVKDPKAGNPWTNNIYVNSCANGAIQVIVYTHNPAFKLTVDPALQGAARKKASAAHAHLRAMMAKYRIMEWQIVYQVPLSDTKKYDAEDSGMVKHAHQTLLVLGHIKKGHTMIHDAGNSFKEGPAGNKTSILAGLGFTSEVIHAPDIHHKTSWLDWGLLGPAKAVWRALRDFADDVASSLFLMRCILDQSTAAKVDKYVRRNMCYELVGKPDAEVKEAMLKKCSSQATPAREEHLEDCLRQYYIDHPGREAEVLKPNGKKHKTASIIRLGVEY